MIAIWIKTQRLGGIDVWFMGEVLFAAYGAILTSLKRSRDTREVLSGGWMGLDFMGGKTGVMLDPDTWTGYVQGVQFKSLTIAEMSKPWTWLEADAHGGILKRSSSNRTVWEGTLKYYYENIVLRHKSMGRLAGKTA